MDGAVLRIIRQSKNMTQTDLANKIGVTAGTICNWERGYTKPDFDIFVDLANALDFKPSELFKAVIAE